MLIICIILIIILIIIYYTRPCENLRESLYYSKILLHDINYSFSDRLLLPPIIKIKHINLLKIKKKSFPLLLVPDIGSSRLYGKWELYKDSICTPTSKYFTQIWPVPQCLSPFIPYANCWKERFIINNKSVKIISKHFGSVHDINMLYKFGIGISFSFYPLINSLKSYKDKKNLFGAPYDFRKISDIQVLEHYFKRVKYLVEYSFKKNKKPIILVGHTLGGILINIFLNYHVNTKWKKKYIKSFIAIHVPFTGCNIAKTALLYGTNEGIGIRAMAYESNQWYHSIEKNINGLYLMLTESKIPAIKKLLFFRNMDPKVKIHFIQCNSDLIDITIPKNWNLKSYKINSSHKKIINNLDFLKLFEKII